MMEIKAKTITQVLICLSLLFLQLSIPSAQENEISGGLNWLISNQYPDGHWGGEPSSPATEFQTTSEVVDTLSNLNTGSSYSNGLLWLDSQNTINVDYLSRKVYALGGAGVSTLVAAQNGDGGWGIDADYDSDILDTALALRALSKVKYSQTTVLESGLNYLLDHQNIDGGFGLLPGENSTPYYTSIVLLALREYQIVSGSSASNLINAITNTSTWLDSQQHGDGGWGNDGISTVYETGLAAYSLAISSYLFNTADTTQYLLNNYSNGSWNQNAYETAIAIRALLILGRSNLVVEGDDISFNPFTTLDGWTRTMLLLESMKETRMQEVFRSVLIKRSPASLQGIVVS